MKIGRRHIKEQMITALTTAVDLMLKVILSENITGCYIINSFLKTVRFLSILMFRGSSINVEVKVNERSIIVL